MSHLSCKANCGGEEGIGPTSLTPCEMFGSHGLDDPIGPQLFGLFVLFYFFCYVLFIDDQNVIL